MPWLPFDKVGVIWGGLATLGWVIGYTIQSRGECWRNPLGRTFLFKSLLIVGLLLIAGVGLFLHLTSTETEVLGWTDTVLLCAIGPVLTWRIWQFHKLFQTAKLLKPICPHCGYDLSRDGRGDQPIV
jgi:hypothetical protein